MNDLILGLLMMKSMTSYEIRKSIQNGLNQLSSDSMGNIHASIKKLLQNKYVEVVETIENGKFKKVYTITQEGKTYFVTWVNLPFDSIQSRNPELKKLFFMALSNRDTRKKRIQEYIDLVKTEKQKLELLYEHSLSIFNTLPDEHKEIWFFQMETLEYGLDSYQFEIDWYQKLLRKL